MYKSVEIGFCTIKINFSIRITSLKSFHLDLGGYNKKSLKTTEIIYPNGSKTEGPIELPDSRDGHCMVEYAGVIISMGGE
jgi:hypothetical protein